MQSQPLIHFRPCMQKCRAATTPAPKSSRKAVDGRRSIAATGARSRRACARRLVNVLLRHLGISSKATGSARWPGTASAIWRSITPHPGMGAICHTINPRLGRGRHRLHRRRCRRRRAVRRDQLRRACWRRPGAAHRARPPRRHDDGRGPHAGRATAAGHDGCIATRTLMDGADEDYAWPEFDENDRRRALLHLRHHRAAEGRALQPPLHRAACLCGQPWRTRSGLRAVGTG